MLLPVEVNAAAREAASMLRERLGEAPPCAVVLGSGWDVLAAEYDSTEAVDFHEVPGLCEAGVEGHRGAIKTVATGAGPLLVQDGRLHCYEGYTSLETCFPVWIYASWGVRALVMFSAAGGLNPVYLPGDLMIVRDHIMLWGNNPLFHLPDEEGRSRFTASHGLYPDRWRDALRGCLPAEARCEEGVYASVPGPSYETGAEAQMLRIAGADAVGMSTAPEALAAGYLGLQTCAVCCISNVLVPYSGGPQSHEVVLTTVGRSAGRLPGLLEKVAATANMLL
ncbi:MAG: purine-nucleoside phosphorylase [Actinobacteria bacterium]|nr:purine-nucleoside phosphorylase [Actinomycetota bacterium]MBU1945242.1 purine-nucleoside phosphorylase [Actinomycetota bacterium]MBU2687814.1 purine-nucleoside phosphorylase [Actinomycetota bacterium]